MLSNPNAPPVRDGDSLVLAQDITASDGTKGKNTVRYSLEDNGNTLIEDETVIAREPLPASLRTVSGTICAIQRLTYLHMG